MPKVLYLIAKYLKFIVVNQLLQKRNAPCCGMSDHECFLGYSFKTSNAQIIKSKDIIQKEQHNRILTDQLFCNYQGKWKSIGWSQVLILNGFGV